MRLRRTRTENKVILGRATPSQTLPPGGGMGKPGCPIPPGPGPPPPPGAGARFPPPAEEGQRGGGPGRAASGGAALPNPGRARGVQRLLPHPSLSLNISLTRLDTSAILPTLKQATSHSQGAVRQTQQVRKQPERTALIAVSETSPGSSEASEPSWFCFPAGLFSVSTFTTRIR